MRSVQKTLGIPSSSLIRNRQLSKKFHEVHPSYGHFRPFLSDSQSVQKTSHSPLQKIRNKDLLRSWVLFRAMNTPILVKAFPAMSQSLLTLGGPFRSLLKNTMFQHFCGGEKLEECMPMVDQLNREGIGSILDYAIEGEGTEEAFDQTTIELLSNISQAAKLGNREFCVVKPTAIGDFTILEKASQKAKLTTQEQTLLNDIYRRFFSLAEKCHDSGLKLMIDAEHHATTQATNEMALLAMKKFNQERPVVYNTLQLYRKDGLDSLKAWHHNARNEKFILGLKLVRGAYAEQEAESAKAEGYANPILSSKDQVDQAYDQSVSYCLANLNQSAICIATHNKKSVSLAIQQLKDRNISKKNDHVAFAQLLGMADSITHTLGDHGYRVFKYIPYGPLEKSVPYLARRAQENKAIAGQASEELTTIRQELSRRLHKD